MIAVSAAAGSAVIDVTIADAERQPGIIAQQRSAIEAYARADGFISSSLHRSLDGARVTTYTQWRTPAAAHANQPGAFAYEVVHVQKASAADPTIVAGATPITLVVVMTCEPGEQAELLAYLIETAIEHSANPGFVSCTIHRSIDGTRVAEYIQWADRAVLGAMLAKPASQAHLARVKPRSSSALYEVVCTVEAAAAAL